MMWVVRPAVHVVLVLLLSSIVRIHTPSPPCHLVLNPCQPRLLFVTLHPL
jgi:hypothetical protein